MNLKCYFQYEDGNFCKKWAMNGSRFCNNHQPPAEAEAQPDGSSAPPSVPLHPYARLATTEELFDLVRHTLYSTSTGAISPAQAYAVSSLVTQWLRVHTALRIQDRTDALTNQMLASLVDPVLAAPEYEPDPDPQPASQHPTPAPLEETAAEAHCDAAAFTRTSAYSAGSRFAAGSLAAAAAVPEAATAPPVAAAAPSEISDFRSAIPSSLAPTSHSPLVTNHLPHDPWAAGRMAGPPPATPPPVDIREAQAKLEALLTEQSRARNTTPDSS